MLPGMKANRVNETIKMECPKVVDTVDIEVSVGDINDHAPWFDPKSLLLTICPNTEVNSVVGQLQGTVMNHHSSH